MKKKNYILRVVIAVLLLVIMVPTANYVVQKYLVHIKDTFVPEYEKVELTEETDYETIFLQTGLGKAAVDRLKEENRFSEVLRAQDEFFEKKEYTCVGLLDWFTREDRVEAEDAVTLVDVQPGDILVTLSTHSLGWRHGHAGLVITPYSTLECAVWGQNSGYGRVSTWTTYSNVAVLRMKDATEEEKAAVVAYAIENLHDVPYHLSSGFIGPKDAPVDAPYFGLHCSYLAWYAWNQFGYDTDSDGGRLASSKDLLDSDLFEVVQIYGLDPREFLKE